MSSDSDSTSDPDHSRLPNPFEWVEVDETPEPDERTEGEHDESRFASLLYRIGATETTSSESVDEWMDDHPRFAGLLHRIGVPETAPDEETDAHPQTRPSEEREQDPLDRVRELIPAGLSPPEELDELLEEWLPQNMKRPREFYALWALAFLTYGVGDIVTTGVGVLYVPEIIESNPLVAVFLQIGGIPGFLLVKIIIFVVLMAISLNGAYEDDLFTYYTPVVAAILLGTALTSWNLLNLLVL